MTDDLASISILVTGTVQGVFFRASTMEQAQSMGLRGWVQNLADGRVEIEAEGSRQSLEDLVGWCHHGPPSARVDEVTTRWGPYRDEHQTFRIR